MLSTARNAERKWLRVDKMSRVREEDENSISLPPSQGGRQRRREILCRCPLCDTEVSIEEGRKCRDIQCPKCGARMEEVG